MDFNLKLKISRLTKPVAILFIAIALGTIILCGLGIIQLVFTALQSTPDEAVVINIVSMVAIILIVIFGIIPAILTLFFGLTMFKNGVNVWAVVWLFLICLYLVELCAYLVQIYPLDLVNVLEGIPFGF